MNPTTNLQDSPENVFVNIQGYVATAALGITHVVAIMQLFQKVNQPSVATNVDVRQISRMDTSQFVGFYNVLEVWVSFDIDFQRYVAHIKVFDQRVGVVRVTL